MQLKYATDNNIFPSAKGRLPAVFVMLIVSADADYWLLLALSIKIVLLKELSLTPYTIFMSLWLIALTVVSSSD